MQREIAYAINDFPLCDYPLLLPTEKLIDSAGYRVDIVTEIEISGRRNEKKTEIQFIRYAPDFCLPYILSSQMHFNEGFWFWKMLSGPGKDNLPITRNPSGIWDSWEERWQKSAPLSDYDRDRQSCLHFFCKLVVQVRSILHFKPLWRMGKC